VTAIAAALASCAQTPPREPVSSTATGTISGHVSVEGAVRAGEHVRVDADPQCAVALGAESIPAGDLVVSDDNSVADAFVHIKEGIPQDLATRRAHSERVVLDQQKCQYVPRVLGVQAGQPLTIRNSDALLHTVRADAVVNGRFNVATPTQGIEVVRSFQSSETMIPVRCDMHPWMKAYIGVVGHPFFSVSNTSGQYAIAQVPPGTYVLEIWHERLGTATREVTLAAGESLTIDFAFRAR
jgi:hypothetical protein